MSTPFICILPDNAGLQLDKFERLMNVIYVCGIEKVCEVLETASIEMNNKMSLENKLNVEDELTNEQKRNYEILLELTHSFKELKVMPFMTLNEDTIE